MGAKAKAALPILGLGVLLLAVAGKAKARTKPEPEPELPEPELPDQPIGPPEIPTPPEDPEDPAPPPPPDEPELPAPGPVTPGPSPVAPVKPSKVRPTEPSKGGMVRRTVPVLQGILRKLGAPSSKALTDGLWGPKTRDAYRAKAAELEPAQDGTIDRAAPNKAWVMPDTFRALQAATVAPEPELPAPGPVAPTPAPVAPVAPEPEPELPELPEPGEGGLEVSAELRGPALGANAAAVQFVKGHAGKPPQIKLAPVLAFQRAFNADWAFHPEAKLDTDSLWGANTREAVVWVLEQTGGGVPPLAAVHWKEVTWEAPTAGDGHGVEIGPARIVSTDDAQGAPAPPPDPGQPAPITGPATPEAAAELAKATEAAKEPPAALAATPEPELEAPAADTPPGYDPAKAKKLARQVVANLDKGRAGYSRELLRSFQKAAGIAVDGAYGGGARGALIHYGIGRPPRAFFAPTDTQPYPWA